MKRDRRVMGEKLLNRPSELNSVSMNNVHNICKVRSSNPNHTEKKLSNRCQLKKYYGIVWLLGRAANSLTSHSIITQLS
jgi:hypothetical protein